MNRDPGLQPERTRLAWLRTSLVLMANALLVIRSGVHERDLLLLAGGGVLAFSALAFAIVGHLRGRQIETNPLTMTQVQMGVVAGCVIFTSACSLVFLI